MKKIFATKGLMVAGLLVAFSSAIAQKKLTEGTILYDVTITSNSDKPVAAELLNGAVNSVYIKPGKTRSEVVSALGTQTTITNQVGAKKEITMLKEYGEQKFMINLTPEDWVEVNRKNENVTFTYDNSATKTIQGYLAKKAVGTIGDSTTFTVWYTPDVVVDSRDFQYINRNLPGLALEFETTLGQLKMTYTASKVSFTPVPASKFELPKSGFRVMSYQESKGSKN